MPSKEWRAGASGAIAEVTGWMILNLLGVKAGAEAKS